MSFRMTTKEQFQTWLSALPDQIEQLTKRVLADTGQKLDYTPASLLVLEQWLLNQYPNLEYVYEIGEYFIMYAAGGYIGESIRRHVGGEWTIELKDKTYAYLGIEGIVGFNSDRWLPPQYPRTWATASLDRRTGNYILTLFEVLINKISG